MQVRQNGDINITIDMQAIEFQPWPKTPRLFRDMTITEKLDGTNAAVVVVLSDQPLDPDGPDPDYLRSIGAVAAVQFDNAVYLVGAQSRNRLIFPGDDNYGFAAWVKDNAFGLAVNLGVGIHYGEWWGSGIQRGYDFTKGQKVFSLFNVNRYEAIVRNNAYAEGESWVPGLRVVPTLYSGPFSEDAIRETLLSLENNGSTAAPGYSKPEGIIVFHSASRNVYKVLLEQDEKPKGAVA